MNSGVPGSPRRRGPPRHAYQYVRPLARTLAIPLRLTCTMASLKFRQLSIQFCGGARMVLLLARDDNDLPNLDLNPRPLLPGRHHGLQGLGDVGLAEGLRAARHQAAAPACSRCARSRTALTNSAVSDVQLSEAHFSNCPRMSSGALTVTAFVSGFLFTAVPSLMKSPAPWF